MLVETSSEIPVENGLIYQLESRKKLGHIFILVLFFAKLSSYNHQIDCAPLKSYEGNLFVRWRKQKKKKKKKKKKSS